jgi:hypothetical protein
MSRFPLGVLLVLVLVAHGCGAAMPDAPPGGPVLVDRACPAGSEAPAVDCTGGPRSSPFTCMRFDDACDVDVQLEEGGPWFRLEGVQGVRVGALRDLADAACGPIGPPSGIGAGGWKKRLAEDLPALLTAVCAPLGDTATLALRRFDDGGWDERVAPATPAKREQVRTCWPSHDACNG